MNWDGRRRNSPRVGVESFCTEFQQDTMQHAIITDLSAGGLCLTRPLGTRGSNEFNTQVPKRSASQTLDITPPTEAIRCSSDNEHHHRGRHGRTIPIEFEIPEVDEVMWALGQVCFDEVKHAPPGCTIGIAGMVRSTGLRLVNAAERHKRILREYVMDTWRETDAEVNDNWLMNAACYRG